MTLQLWRVGVLSVAMESQRYYLSENGNLIGPYLYADIKNSVNNLPLTSETLALDGEEWISVKELIQRVESQNENKSTTTPRATQDLYAHIPRPNIPALSPLPAPITVYTPFTPQRTTVEQTPLPINPSSNAFTKEELEKVAKKAKSYFWLTFAYAIPFLGLVTPFFVCKKTKGWRNRINEHAADQESQIPVAVVSIAWALVIYTGIMFFVAVAEEPVGVHLLILGGVQTITVVSYTLMAIPLYWLCNRYLEQPMGTHTAVLISARTITGTFAVAFVLVYMLGGQLGNLFFICMPLLGLIITALAIYSSIDVFSREVSGWKVFVTIALCWNFLQLSLLLLGSFASRFM